MALTEAELALHVEKARLLDEEIRSAPKASNLFARELRAEMATCGILRLAAQAHKSMVPRPRTQSPPPSRARVSTYGGASVVLQWEWASPQGRVGVTMGEADDGTGLCWERGVTGERDHGRG